MRAMIAIVLSAAALAACTPDNDVTGSIELRQQALQPVQSQGPEAVRRRMHRLRSRRNHHLLHSLHAQGCQLTRR